MGPDLERETQALHLDQNRRPDPDLTRATSPTDYRRRTLARRIGDRETNHLAFTTDPAIGFEKNLAERDIRMIKTRQKISSYLRTVFAAIRSYTATAGKNNINIYQALVQLAEGNAWLPQPT